jgi:DNA-binding winged helix-turn-helix (wHTH) protein
MACETHSFVGDGVEREQSFMVEFGSFVLDAGRRLLTRGAESCELQAKPLDLLIYLIAHHERVVSQSELLDALWPGLQVSPSALAQAVCKVRRALSDSDEPRKFVATLHGRGFRFVAPLRPALVAERSRRWRGDSAGRAVEDLRLALVRLLRVLGETRSMNAATLNLLDGLLRRLSSPDAMLGPRRPLEPADGSMVHGAARIDCGAATRFGARQRDASVPLRHATQLRASVRRNLPR